MDTKEIYNTIVKAASEMLGAYDESQKNLEETENRRQGLEDKLNKIAEILNS